MKAMTRKANFATNFSESDGQEQEDLSRINRVAEGDEAAFMEIYQTTKPIVFGLLLRIIGNYATAEEVLCDVYWQVWRQATRYDSKRGSLLGWLLTITRTRAIDRLRAEKPLRREGHDLERIPLFSKTPEEQSAIAEQQRLVRSVFKGLPPEQRTVLELAYCSGMTQTEIATQLQCPLGTVKTRTRLAMNKMREQLAFLGYNHFR